MIKVYFKTKKSLIFGGHGVRKQISKIYDVVEIFQIQTFGNPNTLTCCPVHCGHDGMLFTALYLHTVDIEIKPFINSPAA